MTPSCSSISYFPSAQTRNSRNGPTATFPEDSIPAHAGKTPGMDTTSHCVSAHPRSRGENGIGTRLIRGIRGSSPLTRGKPLLSWAGFSVLRLIPAHAGKTTTVVGGVLSVAAHPRSRGENPHPRCDADHAYGSSPLTRGKRIRLRGRRQGLGLIPAHAGKTRLSQDGSTSGAAHPRSRGENAPVSGWVNVGCGSSPLTRGKPVTSVGVTA